MLTMLMKSNLMMIKLIGLAALLFMMSQGVANAQALSATKEEVLYIVRSGDSLIGLGQRYFVSPASYKAIEQLNGLENPNLMRVGATIVIPTRYLRYTLLDAKVIALKGQSTVQRAGQMERLSLQSSITEGAVIQTAADGYVTFQISNGSRVAMPSNSRIKILRMRTYLISRGTDTDFVVEQGRTETKAVSLRDNRSRFRVRTPVAISAVRGTVFRIGYDGPNAPSLTEVVEGNVAVEAQGGLQTTLPTGFGAAAAASGKLNKEALLPPPAFAAQGQQQRGSDVIFALNPDPVAIGYHVEIAADPQFVNIVTGARANNALVNLGPLPNGSYWARAMAIAPSGLEGLPQSLPFTRKLEALQSGKLSGDKAGYRLSWDLGNDDKNNGINVFRFQLFEGSISGLPMIDEPGLSEKEMLVYGLPNGRYAWRIGRLSNIQGKIEQYWTPVEILTVEK